MDPVAVEDCTGEAVEPNDGRVKLCAGSAGDVYGGATGGGKSNTTAIGGVRSLPASGGP